MYDMYTCMTITSIRNINQTLLREVQIEAKRQGKSTGEVINEAIRTWSEKQRTVKKYPFRDMKIKLFDWGPGSEDASQRVDEILYEEATKHYDNH